MVKVMFVSVVPGNTIVLGLNDFVNVGGTAVATVAVSFTMAVPVPGDTSAMVTVTVNFPGAA
jgi:hypothetical protein